MPDVPLDQTWPIDQSWLADLETQLQARRDAGLLRTRRVVASLPDGACLVNGQRLRNFAGNDYLNLAHDPRVISAAQNALLTGGAGASSSPLICGRSPWYEELERELAVFEGQPAALLFPSGYAANLGTIAALTGSGDVVFCDRLNHACLVDGCRLSGAKLRVYRHADLSVLERELHLAQDATRRWIVTDGVFSMDGDLAPLRELCQLARRFNACLIVDEAHGTGVFGPQGRGAADELGVEDQVAVRIGTLSKALGSLGGFVTGPQVLIDWLWNHARTQMFSTALPPSCCAAATAALRIVHDEPDRRTSLRQLARTFRDELKRRGLGIPGPADSPIVPIIVGPAGHALHCGQQLLGRGYLVGIVRPPTVPEGTSRLRISLTAASQPADILQLAATVCDVVRR